MHRKLMIVSVSLLGLSMSCAQMNGGGEYLTRSYPAERKRIDIGDYYADFARIRAALGWQPRTPLSEGLSRTLAFYREHLPKYL